MNPEFFKAYDTREVYPEKLGEEDAWKIGHATGRLLPSLIKGYERGQLYAQSLWVGRSMRLHSESLSNALIKGVRSANIGVVGIGMIDTPPMYFAINYPKTSSDVRVTASHNPSRYDGYKVSCTFTDKIALFYRKRAFTYDSQPVSVRIRTSDHPYWRRIEVLYPSNGCRISGRGYPYKDRLDKGHDSGKEQAMAKKVNYIATNVGAESRRVTSSHRADARTDGSYAESWPALVDKYLFCPIRGVGWHTTMALFLLLLPPVLDNLGGRIEDGHGLLWSTVKGLVLASLFICVLLVRRVCRWVWRQMRRL